MFEEETDGSQRLHGAWIKYRYMGGRDRHTSSSLLDRLAVKTRHLTSPAYLNKASPPAFILVCIVASSSTSQILFRTLWQVVVHPASVAPGGGQTQYTSTQFEYAIDFPGPDFPSFCIMIVTPRTCIPPTPRRSSGRCKPMWIDREFDSWIMGNIHSRHSPNDTYSTHVPSTN